ncbi:MAG: ankyrin repeat-containing protein, partial [bacterium]
MLTKKLALILTFCFISIVSLSISTPALTLGNSKTSNTTSNKTSNKAAKTFNRALVTAAKAKDLVQVKNLIDTGAHPDSKDEQGWTALMYLAAQGEVDLVNSLVSQEADVNAQNK